MCFRADPVVLFCTFLFFTLSFIVVACLSIPFQFLWQIPLTLFIEAFFLYFIYNLFLSLIFGYYIEFSGDVVSVHQGRSTRTFSYSEITSISMSILGGSEVAAAFYVHLANGRSCLLPVSLGGGSVYDEVVRHLNERGIYTQRRRHFGVAEKLLFLFCALASALSWAWGIKAALYPNH